MTEDKDIKNSYGFLDSIIEYLTKNAVSYYASISDIYFHIFGSNIEQNEEDYIEGIFRTLSDKNFFEENKYNISDNTQAQYVKLIEALNFLESQEYIKIYSDTHIRLTFKGIFKYSDGFVQGFQKEQESEKRLYHVEEVQKNQNRWLIFLTFLIALGTVVSAIYYLTLMLCNT